MAELLSSASAWMTGLKLSSSSLSMPIRGACSSELLEVGLPLGPALHRGVGTAPVHFMGGGPRTYPGGVTKWQWKRMQLKKTRQMEKARLMREKHVYEARRRAELMAASPVLEMPWQKMSRVRPPNYVSANDQITKLAARFHKSGAEDLWTDNDGPQRFEKMDEDGDHFQSPSSHRHSNAMAHNQEVDHQNALSAMYLDEQGQNSETPWHSQSFRQMPQIKPGSTPYPEPYAELYKGGPYR